MTRILRRALRYLAVLAVVSPLAGCAFQMVQPHATPVTLTLVQGRQGSIVLMSDPPQYTNCGASSWPCADVSGRVFEYVLRNLPSGVSYTQDVSLRTVDTPGLVRITFSAAADAVPGPCVVTIDLTLDHQLLGTTEFLLTVLSRTQTSSAAPVSIAAGSSFSLAVLADGSVRSWGENTDGQLGLGHVAPSQLPNAVPGLSDVAQVAAGWRHSLALKADGTVWAWGSNDDEQLGRSRATISMATTPTLVPGASGIRAVAAGLRHSLALDTAGGVWTWGDYGDHTASRPAPPALVPNLPAVRSIAAGTQESFAVDVDGNVWRWLFFQNGVVQPHQVAGLTEMRTIVSKNGAQLALDRNGNVWSWGFNGNGVLGDGTQTDREVPMPIAGLQNIAAIGIGVDVAVASAADGRTWSWGKPQTRVGYSLVPVAVDLPAVRAVAVGDGHVLAQLTCGTLWGWGNNFDGQLGGGTRDLVHETPSPVPGIGDDGACARVGLHVSATGDVPTGGLPIGLQPGSLTRNGTEYSGVFDRGTTVALTAPRQVTDDFGVLGPRQWTFEQWDLDCAGGAPEMTLLLDRSKRCAAVYRETGAPPSRLTVIADGGRVTGDTGSIIFHDIDCPVRCNAIFPANKVVHLQADNVNGFGFTEWALDCSGSAAEISVTMDRSRTCRATFRPFDLSIAVAGNGTVTVNDLGQDCTGSCTFQPRRAQASLTAVPATGWRFTRWGGDCSGTTPATTVAMTSDRTCTATFSRDAASFFLTTIVEGSGTVRSTPPGVDCSGTCVQLFSAGTTFDLAAVGASGWMVSEWLDDCAAGPVAINHIVLDRDRTCRVRFVSQGAYPIAVMSASPASPRVGEMVSFLGNQSSMYDPATNVHDFTGIKQWNWDFNGDGIYEVSGPRFEADVAQRAFQAPGTYEVRLRVVAEDPAVFDDEFMFITVQPAAGSLVGLTVNKAGGGQGLVVSQPPGLLTCGGPCIALGPLLLNPSTQVTLIAAPLPGFVFTSWDGCDAVGGSPCYLNVTADRTVTARFDVAPTTFTLTVVVNAPSGSLGTIVGTSPAGITINCTVSGGTCSQSFAAGTVVQVRPSGIEGPVFDSWSGCDTITGAGRCNVVLTSNRTVTARFVQ